MSLSYYAQQRLYRNACSVFDLSYKSSRGHGRVSTTLKATTKTTPKKERVLHLVSNCELYQPWTCNPPFEQRVQAMREMSLGNPNLRILHDGKYWTNYSWKKRYVMKSKKTHCCLNSVFWVEPVKYTLFSYISAKRQELRESGKRLTNMEIFFYFRQIVDTVEFLMAKNLIGGVADTYQVQCLLLPWNIMLSHDLKTVKISDFWTEYLLNVLTRFWDSRYHYEWPETMSPEVLEKNPVGYFDRKASYVYSLGVILYRLVFDYWPFKARYHEDTAALIKTRKWSFEPPKRKKRDKEEETHFAEANGYVMVKDLISRMMCGDPDDRLTFELLKRHPWYLAEGLDESVWVPKDDLEGERVEFVRNMMMIGGVRKDIQFRGGVKWCIFSVFLDTGMKDTKKRKVRNTNLKLSNQKLLLHKKEARGKGKRKKCQNPQTQTKTEKNRGKTTTKRRERKKKGTMSGRKQKRMGRRKGREGNNKKKKVVGRRSWK